MQFNLGLARFETGDLAVALAALRESHRLRRGEDWGDAPVRVPHRANRAVIFDSDLFHATDELRFREGYASRRVNIPMLYGRRGAS